MDKAASSPMRQGKAVEYVDELTLKNPKIFWASSIKPNSLNWVEHVGSEMFWCYFFFF